MRTFSIEAGTNSPFIYLDEFNETVEITGNSTLKDAHWFYCNLLKWLIAFNSGLKRTKTVIIKLEKINESTSKWLVLIFDKLSSLMPGSSFEINWYQNNGNSKISECGQLLKSRPGILVNILTHP